jgi:hypothetical protein
MENRDHWWRETRIDFADYYSENDDEFFMKNSKISINELILVDCNRCKSGNVSDDQIHPNIDPDDNNIYSRRLILRLLMIQYSKMMKG